MSLWKIASSGLHCAVWSLSLSGWRCFSSQSFSQAFLVPAGLLCLLPYFDNAPCCGPLKYVVYTIGLNIGGVKMSGFEVPLVDVLVAESSMAPAHKKGRSLGIRRSFMGMTCPN